MPVTLDQIREVPGQGITAKYMGSDVALGSGHLVGEPSIGFLLKSGSHVKELTY